MEQDLLSLDVGPDMTTADLKTVIQSDTGIPQARQVLYYNGQHLADGTKTMGQMQLKEGDMLAMLVQAPSTQGPPPRTGQPQAMAPPPTSRAQGGRGEGGTPQRERQRAGPEELRLQALGDPRVLEQLRRQVPELADAVQDPQRFQRMWEDLARNQEEAERAKQREMALLNEDPFNVEAQAKIEEIIRQEAVMENLQHAVDYNPEGTEDPFFANVSVTSNNFLLAFGRVHMLYIDVEVNDNKVKAFVDSGAQTTIMSPSCAEQCGIMRLIDKRFSGIARGVGTAKILGRVHSAQIKIGSLYLACSFTVMEGKDVDLLLGLDMLKRHQACVDLRKGSLVIGDVEVPFLGEAEIPKHEEILMDEPTVEGPGGLQVGGRSGTVMAPGTGSKNSRGQGQAVGGAAGTASGQRPQAPPQPTNTQRQPSFPPGDVAQLMDMGFSREVVLRALELAGGNVELAAGLLL